MQIMINNSNNKAPPVLAGSLAIPSQHCKFVITHAERAPGAPWWCCEGWSWHTAWHRKRGCCDPRCSTRRPGAKAQGQALLLHRGLAPQADGSFFWHGSWLRLAPRPPKPAVVALGKLSLLPSIQHRAAEHHRREQMGVGNY